MKIGVYVFGLASIAAGILDLIWGEFEPAHQPIQAWGDHIPGVTILSYIAALWLIAGGGAMLWRNSERFGAAALTILYAIFVLFPLPRLYTAPRIFGHHPAVYIGVFVAVAQQLILFVAAAIAYASSSAGNSLSPRFLSPRAAQIARWIFALCCLDFGLAHFTSIQIVASMVPKWLPFGGATWSVLTGIAFLLAGLAIVSGVLDVLAAQLLGLMLLVFSLLVLTPSIFASPHKHVAWGANAYNLTAVGAAWIVAEWLAKRREPVQEQESAIPAPAWDRT